VAGTRDWAVGLYDGKIRLRADELGTEMQQVIVPHELAHAFIRQHYGSTIPLWLNEGLAQLQEPERLLTAEGRYLLERIRSRTLWVPLEWLDRRFHQPADQKDLEGAYMQARVIAQHLVQRFGNAKVRAFLEKIAQGKSLEEAYDQTFTPHAWARLAQGSLP
jgi:hypothetical protein